MRLRGHDENEPVVFIHQDFWTADFAFPYPKWVVGALRFFNRHYGNSSDHPINTIALLVERPVGGEALTQSGLKGVLYSVIPGRLPLIADSDTYDVIDRKIRDVADVRIEFTLARNGIAQFELPGLKLDKEIKGEQKKSEQLQAANRMFFALKDFLHTHQHHTDDDDMIIQLEPVEDDDHFEWALRTLFSLYRYIIGQKRKAYDRTERDMVAISADILGVLAYARTFQKIARNYWKEKHPGKRCPLPVFADRELEQSLATARDSVKFSTDWKYGDRINAVVILLGTLAVYYGALQALGSFKPQSIMRDGKDVPLNISGVELGLLEFVTNHFFLALFLPVPIAFILVVWRWANRHLRGWSKEYLFGTVRLAIGMNRREAVAAFFIVAVLGAAIGTLAVMKASDLLGLSYW